MEKKTEDLVEDMVVKALRIIFVAGVLCSALPVAYFIGLGLAKVLMKALGA